MPGRRRRAAKPTAGLALARTSVSVIEFIPQVDGWATTGGRRPDSRVLYQLRQATAAADDWTRGERVQITRIDGFQDPVIGDSVATTLRGPVRRAPTRVGNRLRCRSRRRRRRS